MGTKEEILLANLLENYMRDAERYRKDDFEVYCLMTELANQTIAEILSSIEHNTGRDAKSVTMYAIATMLGVIEQVELRETHPICEVTHQLAKDVFNVMCDDDPIGYWHTELVFHGDKDVGKFLPTDEELEQ